MATSTRQSKSGNNAFAGSATHTGLSVTLDAAAAAGNRLVATLVGDKNLGTVSAAGWTVVQTSGASVTVAIAHRPAVAGDTTITWAWTTATRGASSHLMELANAGSVVATVQPPYSDATVTSFATGLAPAATGPAFAVAVLGVDSQGTAFPSNPVTSAGWALAARLGFTQSDPGESPHVVATTPVTGGAQVGASFSWAGSTADQTTGLLLSFADTSAGGATYYSGTFEAAGTDAWVSGNNAPAVTRSTAYAHSGSASLLVTPTVNATCAVYRDTLIPVAPNTTYTISWWSRALAGPGRNGAVSVNEFDAVNYLKNTYLTHSPVVGATESLRTQTFTTGGSTTRLQLYFEFHNALTTDRLHLDDITVTDTTGGGAGPGEVSDNFNRADNATTLGAATSGHTYSVRGTAGILGSQAYFPSANGDEIALVDFGSGDMVVQATSPNLAGKWCLLFRAASFDSNWQLETEADGTWYVYYRTGGSWTPRMSGTGATAGSIWRVTCAAASITVHRNGIQVGALTSGDLQTATKAGFRRGTFSNASPNARWDDFSVTTPSGNAGTGSTLTVSHAFTGDTAAGAGLGTTDTGQVWRTERGSWRRLGGKALGTSDDDHTSVEVGQTDMEVRVKAPPRATNAYFYALGRLKGPDDYYWAEVRPDGAVTLLYRGSTGYNGLGVTAAGVYPAAGAELGLRCQGDTFSALVDGAVVLEVVDTRQASPRGTRAGLRHGAWTGSAPVPGIVIEYDDFKAYTPGRTLPLTDGFTGADGSVPNADVWTRLTTGTDVTVVSNQLRMALARGSYAGTAVRAVGLSFADFEAVVHTGSIIPVADRASGPNSEHYKNVAFRGSDWPDTLGDPRNGYLVELNPNYADPASTPWFFRLLRRNGGADPVGTQTVLAEARMPAGSVYDHSVRIRAVGRRIQARVWERYTSEPTVWHLDVTDDSAGAITGAGLFGLAAFAGAAVRPGLAVYWDDLNVTSVTGVPPAVVVTVPAHGLYKTPIPLAATSDQAGSTYAWSITTRPAGSTAAVSGSGSNVTFTPDRVGAYAGQVVVTAGGQSTTETFAFTTRAALWTKVGGVRRPVRLSKKVLALASAPTLTVVEGTLAAAPVLTVTETGTAGATAKLFQADVAFYETPIPANPVIDPMSADIVNYIASNGGIATNIDLYNASIVTAGAGVRRFKVGDPANPLTIRAHAFIGFDHPDLRGFTMTKKDGTPYVGFPIYRLAGGVQTQFIVSAVTGDRKTGTTVPNLGSLTTYGQTMQDGNVTWMHVGAWANGGGPFTYGDCVLNGVTVPVPADSVASTGDDAWCVVFDETTGNAYGLWQTDFTRDGNGNVTAVTISFGNIDPVSGDGRSTRPIFNQTDTVWMQGGQLSRGSGAGINVAMGDATWAELQAALDAENRGDLVNAIVPHALHFSSNITQGPSNSTNFRFPATTTDGGLADWNPASVRMPEGSRWWLDVTDAEIAAMNSAFKRIMARTARKYGLYCTDYGDAPMNTSTEFPWKPEHHATRIALGNLTGYWGMTGAGGWPISKLKMLAKWDGT